MKKEYKTPEAEVMEFNYAENVVASLNNMYGRNDETCMKHTNEYNAEACSVVGNAANN